MDIRQSFIVILVLCVVTAAVLILVTISLAVNMIKEYLDFIVNTLKFIVVVTLIEFEVRSSKS